MRYFLFFLLFILAINAWSQSTPTPTITPTPTNTPGTVDVCSTKVPEGITACILHSPYSNDVIMDASSEGVTLLSYSVYIKSSTITYVWSTDKNFVVAATKWIKKIYEFFGIKEYPIW